jgi:hydrogenase nickel incorporation protein HypA/HybF
MHELSIALSIVDGVLEELECRGTLRASAVHVRVGKLSGVDRDALCFSYGIACEGTPLAHSQLVVEDVDVEVFCPACQNERPIACFPVLTCADCGMSAERVTRGNELEITGVELAS